jgi:tetratricopeptide (TPR) repeat protein
MSRAKKFNAKEQALLGAIRDEIEHLADTKEMTLSRLGHKKVEREALIKECEEQFFDMLQKQLANDDKNCHLFYQQLKTDNEALYQRIHTSLMKVLPYLEGCKTLQDLRILNKQVIAPKELEEIYRMGRQLFAQEHFQEALLYFAFLSCIDAENPDIWFAKGMAEHNLGHFEEALHSYSMTIALAPHYLPTHIQVMNCLILAKHFEQAQEYYNTFMHEIDSQMYADNENLKMQLASIQEFLEHPVH